MWIFIIFMLRNDVRASIRQRLNQFPKSIFWQPPKTTLTFGLRNFQSPAHTLLSSLPNIIPVNFIHYHPDSMHVYVSSCVMLKYCTCCLTDNFFTESIVFVWVAWASHFLTHSNFTMTTEYLSCWVWAS